MSDSIDVVPSSVSLPPLPPRTKLRVWANTETHAFRSKLIQGVRFDCLDCDFVCFELGEAFQHQSTFSLRHFFSWRRLLGQPTPRSMIPDEAISEPDWSKIDESQLQTWYVRRIQEYNEVAR